MSEQEEICKEGLEEHPKGTIIFGNIVMLFWFTLGALACWFFYPLLGLVYLFIAFVLVYIVLRKIVCVNCYYYDKWCGLGWGKLCAAMFKKGRMEDFPKSIGVKLAPATYGMLMIIPLILLIVSIIVQGFSWYKIVVLVLLLLVSFYSGGISRKSACVQCKMNTCPGSTTKKK